jgi:hypothetical protein
MTFAVGFVLYGAKIASFNTPGSSPLLPWFTLRYVILQEGMDPLSLKSMPLEKFSD